MTVVPYASATPSSARPPTRTKGMHAAAADAMCILKNQRLADYRLAMLVPRCPLPRHRNIAAKYFARAAVWANSPPSAKTGADVLAETTTSGPSSTDLLPHMSALVLEQ